MHWPVPAELLQPHLPPRLQVDTHDGMAWLAVVPFRMWKVRTRFTPPVPGAHEFLELNVRTYVHLDGVPGVWFFSLDATNAAGRVGGAHVFQPALPARHHAPGKPQRPAAAVHGHAHARRGRRPPASAPPGKWARPCRPPSPARWRFFSPSATASTPATGPRPSSTGAGWRTRRGRCTRPRLLHYESTLIESHGLPTPAGAPAAARRRPRERGAVAHAAGVILAQ